MRRNSLLEMSGRIMHTFARVTLNKADDDPKWQEASADGFNSDSREKIERVQSYGYTSVPLPRDEQKQSSNSGSASDGEQPKGPAAEGIVAYMGGQRNHPVLIAVDDRRHRPRGMKPGESAQYDDQGQMTYLKRDGNYILSPKKVSLRHVTKEKQKAGKEGANYKHEGEDGNVTAEIKIEEGRIVFLIGGEIMGEIIAGKFVVGGAANSPDVKEIHRKDDIDDAGDKAKTHAKKGWAV